MTKRIFLIEASEGTAVADAPTFHDYEFNWIPGRLYSEGVIKIAGNALKVQERAAGANMTVDVLLGEALIEITNTNTDGTTYKVLWSSDALENIPITTADGTHPRKDIVVARVDVSTDPDTSAGNVAILEVIAGTAQAVPVAPSVPSNAILLATVDIPASDTTISNAQITDGRVEMDLDSTGTFPSVAREADLVLAEDDAVTWLGTITGTDTLTGTSTPARTAYADGMRFAFIVGVNNTGVVTLNVDGIGADDLFGPDGTALSAGDLVAGGLVECRHDGTQFVMTSPIHAPASAGGLLGTITTASPNIGSSSTSEDTLSPTFTGSSSIDANSLAVGDVIHIRVSGNYRIDSDNLSFKVYIGGVQISNYLDAFQTDAAERQYDIDMYVTVRSLGATGKLWPGNSISTDGDVAGSGRIVSNGERTVDTTGALPVTFTGTFDTSNGNHNLNIQAGFIKVEPVAT